MKINYKLKSNKDLFNKQDIEEINDLIETQPLDILRSTLIRYSSNEPSQYGYLYLKFDKNIDKIISLILRAIEIKENENQA